MQKKILSLAFASLALALLIISAGCTSSSSSSSYSSSPTTSYTTKSSTVEIVNQSVDWKSYGDPYASGIVVNSGGKSVTAFVKLDVYTEDGVKLGSGTDVVKIDPYGKSQFEAIAFGTGDKIKGKFKYRIYIDSYY